MVDLVYACVCGGYCGVLKSPRRPENERAKSRPTWAVNSEFDIESSPLMTDSLNQ